MKIGICMTGPACIVRRRIAIPAAHRVEVALTASASTTRASRSPIEPSMRMPLISPAVNTTRRTNIARDHRRDHVAGDDPAAVGRCEQQPAGEAELEVGGDREAREHAAERGRLDATNAN